MADWAHQISAAPDTGVVPLSAHQVTAIPGTDLHAAMTYSPVSSGGGPSPTRVATVLQPTFQPLQPSTGPLGIPVQYHVPSSAQISLPHRSSGASSGGADLLPNLASPEDSRFAIGGSARSVPLSLLPLDPLKKKDQYHNLHQAADFFTIGLFCLFGPSMILGWNLGSDMDVAYWITRLGLFSGVVLVFIFCQHLIQLRAIKNDKPVPQFFFLCIALAPAIFFTITGGIYYRLGQSTAAELAVSECKGDNLVLQKAYTAAQGLWNTCVAEEVKKNGGKSLMQYPNVQSCPNFKEEESKEGVQNWKGYDNDDTTLGKIGAPGIAWSVEWDYFSKAEVNHVCAGWCDVPNAPHKPRIWSAAGTPAEPCQNFVAHKMLIVEHQGLVIMCIGILTMILSVALWVVLRATLQQLGHS